MPPYGQSGSRPPPFSLRLTAVERARLETQAGDVKLGAYIKSLLFAEDAPKYRKRRRGMALDEKKLAEVLACLGASRLSSNLNQLAKSANSGALYFDYDTKQAIKRACDDVGAMRVLLMRALGLKVDVTDRPKESTSQSFARAASDSSPRI